MDEVNDTLTSWGAKVQSNPRIIVWSCIIIALVVCCILIYVYAVRQPAIQAGNEALGQADVELLMGNDSLALAKYKAVAAQHGYDAGNLAKINAAILLYKDGKYEEALKYLNDYEASEDIIGSGAQALMGDCYVNMGKYDQALECFRKAQEVSDNNPHYTPTFMIKEATVLRELKKYSEEAAVYQKILDEYPNYGQETGIDVEKYLSRAQNSK